MGIINKLNQVIDYIEENITSDIEVTELAKIVGMNILHFQSLFSVTSEMTIAEYIRKRRLSRAAEDLQKGKSVTEVTYTYGYSSPDSFTRAFRKLHGVNPSIAKQQEVKLITHPKLSFQFTLKGVKEMNFKIIDREAFNMYGLEKTITNIDGENLKEIPEFWDQVMNDGSFKKLLESTNQDYVSGDYLVNGVMCYEGDIGNTFPYAIAAFETETSNDKGFKKIEIDSYKWVVFTTDDYKPSDAVEHIQELWRKIFAEWLPSVEYQIIEGPNMEIYGARENKLEYCEVWLPLEKL